MSQNWVREPRVVTRVHDPRTLEEALGLLASLGDEGAVLAGGTWIMRAPLRQEATRSDYVSLQRLDMLRRVEPGEGELLIGAMVTHEGVGAIETGTGALGGLCEAARRSAFPAVRAVATLGGNLAAPFTEADLVPALLAAEASVELATVEGAQTVAVAEWLRRSRPALITAVRVPQPPGRRAWFERLTVRSSAEYAIVSVAVSVDLAPDGTIAAARFAVGSVEPCATRVPAAEAALLGQRPDDHAGRRAGEAAAGALTARDGLDAPGWYRLAVLPALAGRVVARLAD